MLLSWNLIPLVLVFLASLRGILVVRDHRDRRLLALPALDFLVLAFILPFARSEGMEPLPWIAASITVTATWLSAQFLREHQQTLHELRFSEDKFNRAFLASPDSITISSLDKGEILEVNKGFERLTGYRRDEAVGRTVKDLGLWADLDDRHEMLEILNRHGEVRSVVWRGLHRSGKEFPGLFSGVKIELGGKPCLISVVRDLADLSRARQAQRASEERFALAFRASPDAMMLTALPDGRFLEVNDGFTEVCGYSRDETVGKTARELGLWAEEAERDHMFERLKETRIVREMEFRARMKSGKIRDCILSGALVELNDKPALLTVVRDVHDLKRTQEAREALYDELRAKNDELERFAFSVSHDLKGPLFTLRGFLQLLEKDLAAGDETRVAQDIARLTGAAESMDRMLENLLELSRAGRILDEPEVVSPNELVEEVLEMLAGQIEQRGAHVEVAPDMPHMLGDRQRLLQVFLNLISNGIKFTELDAEPRVEIQAQRKGPLVECTVKDFGSGVPPEHQEKVFQLFERLGKKNEGTGIGLALVRRIVETHGGTIELESAGDGEGTTLRFTIPAFEASSSGD